MTDFSYELKICPENRDLLDRDIRQVENGKNYGRVNAARIEELIREIENTLYRVARNDLIGTIALIDCNAAEKLSLRSIPPDTTQVTLEYKEDGWYVVNIQRASIQKKRYIVHISDKAEASIKRHWGEDQR